MLIFVKNPSGDICPVVLESLSCQVLDLKSVIEKRQGIPVEEQRLFVEQTILAARQRLSQYNIKELSTLLLARRNRKLANRYSYWHLVCSGSMCTGGVMDIFIHTLYDKTVKLEVSVGDTVFSLKERLHQLESIPLGQQQFIFANDISYELLEDSVILTDFTVYNESTVLLALREGNVLKQPCLPLEV